MQLANPIPTSAYRQLGVALQPPGEAVLVEICVVEGIEVRRQSPHRPDELKLPGDAVAGETEAHFTREFESVLRLPLDLAERISGGETVRDQVDACIRRVREVAGILRCLEGAPQEGATDPQVLRPVGHVDGKDQVHAGAETVEPMLFHQVEPEPAEAKPGLVVPEVRPQHAAQPRISEARSVAVAVLQAEGRHPTDDEAEKIQVREQGRRGEDREHVHGRTPVRIAHQRQIEQRLDRARVEPLPQVVIFLPDVIRRGTQRPVAVDPLQVIAPHRDGAVAQVQRRIEIDAHASDGRRVDDGLCASRQHGEVLSRQRQLPGQILALRLVELEFEHEPVAFFPSALRQQGTAGQEILQSRGIRGCRLGPPSRHEVELGHLLALLLRHDQRRAAVELVHDFKDVLFEVLRRRLRREQPADPEMRHGALAFVDERISRLLDTVVDERVGPVRADDQSSADGVPQRGVHRFLALPMDQRERGRFGNVPETGQLSQRLLGGSGQAAQLRSHEIRDVVGKAFGADARHVPGPGQGAGIESQERLLFQGEQELDGEKRVAVGLLEYQASQGSHALAIGVQGIGKQPFDIVRLQSREQDLPHHAAGSPDHRQHPRERVRGADLVVAIGADQEQVPHVGVEDEVLDQFEGCAIQPLQVVEEQRERVLGSCKHAEKTPEHQLEAILPFLLRELRNRRLLADDESQLRDEVDHELAVRAKRI